MSGEWPSYWLGKLCNHTASGLYSCTHLDLKMEQANQDQATTKNWTHGKKNDKRHQSGLSDDQKSSSTSRYHATHINLSDTAP